MVEAPSTHPEVWKLLMNPRGFDWCCFSLVIFVPEGLMIVLMTNRGTPSAARNQTVELSRSWEVTGDPGELGRKLQERSSGKNHQFVLMIKPSSPRQQVAVPQEGGHLNLKRRSFLQQHSAALLTTRENNIQPTRNPLQTLELLPVSAAGTGNCRTLAQKITHTQAVGVEE